MSGDEYQGLPEFRLLVDGQQVGGIHTVTADHALGQWQTVNFDLDASIPLNEIRVEFLNDAYGGSADKDRNLYVDSIEVNGAKLLSQDAIYDRNGAPDLPGQAAMSWAGALVFDVAGHNGHVAAPSGDTTHPTAPHTTIAVHVSGDEYQGLPEFRLLADGQQVGEIHTLTADHALGQWQTVNFELDASIPLNDIRVEFLNDAYGGSADKDRNLYVDSIEVNGAKLLSQDAIYDRNGAPDLPGQTDMPWAGALVFDAAGHNVGAGTSYNDTCRWQPSFKSTAAIRPAIPGGRQPRWLSPLIRPRLAMGAVSRPRVPLICGRWALPKITQSSHDAAGNTRHFDHLPEGTEPCWKITVRCGDLAQNRARYRYRFHWAG